MKKIVVTVAALLFMMQVSKAQTDSSEYRKLKFQEINFITSYYSQDGNHSAVTGGEGTEHLTDFGNSIDLHLKGFDRKLNVHNLSFELGLDTYTSASSNNIDKVRDPNFVPVVSTSASSSYKEGGTVISSASKSDFRISPSVNYLFENVRKNFSIGTGLSFSNEFDYTSFGANLLFVKSFNNKNTEFSAKASAFLDQWKILLPLELRGVYNNGFKYDHLEKAPRNSYNLALAWSQVLNREIQFSLLADIGYQTGQLGTAYQRVYFYDGDLDPINDVVYSEKMPDTRFKTPFGVRLNYFMTDRIILRSFYRYYSDDWGIKAHTAEVELPIKITPFISLAPFYRYYTQTEAKYFKPMGEHLLTDEFYTSDYDLSKFNSNMFGINFRLVSGDGILGIRSINTLELRYNYYDRSDGLNSHLITLALKFK
ncbi:MAG: DUF3570 domain-containing protein [Sphingobacteriia bacterium]|nr:DUF3570 domain-containing protein [Sphingobacteriia bacterium]